MIEKNKEVFQLQNKQNNQCLECSQQLDQLVYAIYRSHDKNQASDNENSIVGYICDICRKKHKMKALRGNDDHLKKSEQLKALLSGK
jgi:hypothetical protein